MGALLQTWLLLDGPEVEGSRRINTTYNSDGGFLQSNTLVKLFITYHPHYGGEFGISMRQFPKASLGSFGASGDAPIMTVAGWKEIRESAFCIACGQQPKKSPTA